jgi:hypothetical protein
MRAGPTQRIGQRPRASFAAVLFSLLCLLPPAARAAELGDPAKLPPPASVTVDFQRDIRPLLENACLRCHGPEKPKGGYRLDTRDAAIQGGDLGAAIVPGDSAASPLIHYVARLVEDMEMPPTGKGDPLTTEQVALLRAWVDQGVKWEGQIGVPTGPQWSMTLPVRWLNVSGDEAKFREHHWQESGLGGGIEEFTYRETQGDRSVAVTARALAGSYDFGVTFDVRETDRGFIRGGVEQFRRWTDDSGGYYSGFDPSVAVPQFSLGRELYMDIGRAWVDFGLTLPDWPEIVLGYEYQWRDGSKSLLQWGLVDDGIAVGRHIYPAVKDVDERNHIVKLDVNFTLADWEISESFRGEFTEFTAARTGVTYYDLTSGAVGSRDTVIERHDSFTGANILSAQRQLTDWAFVSGGYLYSKLDADEDYFRASELAPGAANTWRSTQIALERESHVANLNGVLGPWESFSLALGAQADWTRQEGLSMVALSNVFVGALPPLDLSSDLDILRVKEFALLRYTGLRFATLYAEGRLEQERVDQVELDNGAGLFRDTDAATDGYDARAGFHASLGRGVTWNGHYRHFRRDSDFDHNEIPAGDGYSAFILDRRTTTDEIETRLNFAPLPRLRASLSYRWQDTAYDTRTADTAITGGVEGVALPGTYEAHNAGLLLTFAAWRNLDLSGSFNYQDIRSRSTAVTSAAIVPYDGDILSVWGMANYRLNARTGLFARYSASWADFAQDNAAAGLPLGIEYTQHTVQAGVTRQLNEHLKSRFGYGYYTYDEPASGGLNDYDAHLVFGALSFVWR